MLCPECNHNLIPITLRGDTSDVVLDVCQNCGGVWSDQGETNFVKSKDLQPLINMLPKVPPDTHANYQMLVCPHDGSPMRHFQGDNVPQFITLLRCNACGGIWFPKKYLIDFKMAQEAKTNYFKLWRIPLPSIYAVLLPLLLLIILGSGLVITILNLNQNTDVRIKAAANISRPVVISPDATTVLISFNSQMPSLSKIRYWINPNEITEVDVSATPKTTHTIILKSLDDNRTYSYQLVLTDPENNSSPIYTFSTKKK